MQRNLAESHSIVTTENSSSQTVVFGCSDSIHSQTQRYDDIMSQLPVTSIIHGDSLSYGHVNPSRPSMAVAEPQTNNNQFVDELALAACMSTAGNQGCNVVNSLFKSSSCYGSSEGLSSQWELSKFLTPSQELLDRALARTGVIHSIPWTTRPSSSSGNLVHLSNELSLSLSMSEAPPKFVQGRPPNVQEQCSEMSSSSGDYSLEKRIVVAMDHTSCSSYNNNNNNFDDNSRKVSPFVGGSRMFLQAMQGILAEIAFYAVENLEEMAYCYSSSVNGDGRSMLQSNPLAAQRESEEKKKLLVALLQLVDERYSQCIDEIHTVVSAFHAVTELDPNLHARFALPTISFMCKNLRDRISSQILAMGCDNHYDEAAKQDNGDKSFEASFIQKQWALQQLKKRDQQLWRPQRGLPERSVSVLRAWMFQNFLHPYPKDAEKHLLALKSGLTRSQVSNWFINARVRLWKPMIEEMYAEMNQRKVAAAVNDDDSNPPTEEEEAAAAHMRNVQRRFAAAAEGRHYSR